MKFVILIFFAGLATACSQSIDYNTKKGFVAEGYDVVAYFNDKAVEGSKAHIATYEGVNYKFESQKNLNIFLENPQAFIPQYGGYCAYAIAMDSKKVGIDPETFEIRDGKLYLFYNSWGINTLKKWLKNDVKALQQKADLNWKTIKSQ